MAYTTNQLIAGAYYAAGVVSREFETVNGGQISDGLGWLNDILTEKRVNEGMVPYESKYSFNSQVGQESYFIPNLIQIDTLVFYLDKVRYSMQYSKRHEYFGSPRVENINTLPYNWYWERKTGGGYLHIYFLPDKNYPMEIHGTFGLNTVALNQDMTANVTIADLGVPKTYGASGSFYLNPGQLVISTPGYDQVNSVDLTGYYDSIGALVNYINTGILQNVTASIVINDFVLSSTSQPPTAIYVQTNGDANNGQRFIGNVALATTENLASVASYNNGASGVGATLTGIPGEALAIDGLFPSLNAIVLIKDQTLSYQNGSYIVTQEAAPGVPYILTRTTNYNQPSQIQEGDDFMVTEGNVNSGLNFVQTADVSNVGVSPIIFQVFNTLTFSNFSLIGSPLYEIFNPNGFDQFYITYLRYALADRICAEYNYTTPDNVLRQLSKYEAWIEQKSRIIDLRLQKTSSLTNREGYNWAFINLGKGWVPS
jgi:hypothetical protein